MKIEGDKPSVPTGATDRLERPADRPTASAKPVAAAAPADQLKLSPDAQLVQSGVEAAAKLPPVRNELIERMRALLASGELGTNPDVLADAIIDNWLGTTRK